MNNSLDIIKIKETISTSWQSVYSALLCDEHLLRLQKNIVTIQSINGKIQLEKPNFDEETTALYLENISTKDIDSNDYLSFSRYIENEKIENLLILLGQRLTSASIRNEKGIPPTKDILFESCFSLHNSEVSNAVRAWEKHVGRSSDDFWGKVKGSRREKEEKVKGIINYIIDHKTWWNIFEHYKHELVYEIRVKSGHGIRWSHNGDRLIGFLEPFIN